MRTSLWTAAVAALCGCATVQQSMASHPWYEVKTQHFRILTDAEPKQAAKVAADLERHRRALLLLWSPDANPESVTSVAMPRNGPEFFELAGEGAVGYFAPFPRHPTLVFPADQFLGASTHEVLVHELAHLVTQLVAPGPPPWLNEGLSDYLETVRLSAHGEVAFGGPNRDAMGVLTSVGLMGDLDKLSSWSPVNQTELSWYYATAWALCHYLISEKPGQFSVMMRELAAGRDGRAAWRAAFGDVPLSSYRRAVHDYAARGRWQLLTTQLPPVPEQSSVRRLSPGEVQAVIAWFNVIARRQMDVTVRAANLNRGLDQAEKLDPTSPLVQEFSRWREVLSWYAEQKAREQAPAVCPDDVVAGEPLSPGSWAPKTLARTYSPAILEELDQGSRAMTAGYSFDLTVGEIMVLAGAPGGSPALLVLRQAGPAGCVVNGWRDQRSQTEAVTIANWWKAKDASQILLLLTFDPPRPAGAPGAAGEPRWMALATDGKRAWWAARGKDGSPVLPGFEPRMRREKGKLVLVLKAAAGGGDSASYPLEVEGEFGAAGQEIKPATPPSR